MLNADADADTDTTTDTATISESVTVGLCGDVRAGCPNKPMPHS